MSIAQLKAEIVAQVSKLESEEALLEIRHLLETLNNNGEKPTSLTEIEQADKVFAKAVQQYDAVLEKLAQ